MSYVGARSSAGEPPRDPRFHNIRVQPEAYRHFARTGALPDKTIFVMEVLSTVGSASINKQGRFAERSIGIEAAVEDIGRFPEEWSYYSFIGPGDRALTKAKRFAEEMCGCCHRLHGAVYNAFVHFYPVLREVQPKGSL